jgi:hypothetical protein
VARYWSFFDPSFLFVTGDSSLINSTRGAGFFPMAFAVLIPVGLYALVRSRGPVAIAILIGFVTAPLVSMISGAIEMNRVMFAIPFGVLTAAHGVDTLVHSRVLAAKAIAVLLVLSVPWQFAGFHAGYFGDYRSASASWFAGNAREAIRATMARAAGTAGPVYVAGEIEWVHRTWRFYAIADGRTEMIDRVVYVSQAPTDAAPAGSLLLVPSNSAMARQRGWEPVEAVTSIGGRAEFSILRRGTE